MRGRTISIFAAIVAAGAVMPPAAAEWNWKGDIVHEAHATYWGANQFARGAFGLPAGDHHDWHFGVRFPVHHTWTWIEVDVHDASGGPVALAAAWIDRDGDLYADSPVQCTTTWTFSVPWHATAFWLYPLRGQNGCGDGSSGSMEARFWSKQPYTVLPVRGDCLVASPWIGGPLWKGEAARERVVCPLEPEATVEPETRPEACPQGDGVVLQAGEDRDRRWGACAEVNSATGPVEPPASAAPCGELGATIQWTPGGVAACITWWTEDDEELVDVDLSPCPRGTDPRVVVAGHAVVLCLVWEVRPTPPRPPAQVDLTPCPQQGTDPSVSTMGQTVEVCAWLHRDLGLVEWGSCPGYGRDADVAGTSIRACA